MSISRNRICKQCGKSYPKKAGYSKHHCTDECATSDKRKRACGPDCVPQNLRTRVVRFSNGIEHVQQYCVVCRVTSYVTGHIHNGSKGLNIHAEQEAKRLKRQFGDSFYTSPEWAKMRYQALTKYGPQCQLCGSTEKPMHVDHIKPRSKYPDLELSVSNLQILCALCNRGKSNDFDHDFRGKS